MFPSDFIWQRAKELNNPFAGSATNSCLILIGFIEQRVIL
jgi:hypothetical protein